MRKWFSRFGATPPASLTRPSTSTPASASVATPVERIFTQDYGDSVPPPPPTPLSDVQPNNWNADFASDPGCWEELFDAHWEQVELIMGDMSEVTYEKVVALLRYLGFMTQLLMMEMNAQPEPAIGAILDRYFITQIMEKVVDWAIDTPQFLTPTCQVGLIRIYEMIVSESHTPSHCLLVHKPLLLPLVRLLEWCRCGAEKRSFTPSNIDKHFVLLLNQICTKMAEDVTLLHFFFTFSGKRQEQFLVFSLLIPYLYDCGDVGQLARDALLLVLSVSRKLECVAAFVAVNSNFCPVVATGLSGCFSQLPSDVGSVLQADEGWHKISLFDIEAHQSLTDFHSSLLFCNAVVQVAHEYVVTQIVTYIFNGFLLPVVLPSLLQTGQEELVSSTAYYHLCLDTVTEAPLIQAFLKLLIVEESQTNKKVIEVIIERISIGNRLSQVSLSLLRAIIELRCEDVMLDLIFKYLLPCTYLQPNQTAMLRSRAYVVPMAKHILSLIPECTLKSTVLCSQGTLQSYMEESQKLVQLTADSCAATWAWSYDGLNPPTSTFRSSSDEETSQRANPFVRRSSMRSSLVSARNGLNRYFGGHTRRQTAESFSQQAPLPELGQPEELARPMLLLSEPGSPFPEIDLNEFVITPITPNPAMMTTSMDYFQFAYDEISESEAESCALSSRSVKNAIQVDCALQPAVGARKDSSTSGDGDTDLDVKRSFVLRGWGEVQDMDTFMDLLGRIPVPPKFRYPLEENLALINSKIQYLDELKAESAVPEKAPSEHDNSADDKELVIAVGQPIKCSAHQGVGPFLESLLRCLENMLDNSFYLNLQLTSVLATLASFSHPLLASYFFDQNLNVRPGIKRLFKILEILKTRIDAFASSVEGFDVLLERGVRLLKAKADRYDKIMENNRVHVSRNFLHSEDSLLRNGFSLYERPESSGGFLRFRPFGGSVRRAEGPSAAHPHSFRYFSHKAMETRRATMDQARAKQIVFAAIILSQFCQELSTILLQHTVVVSQPCSPQKMR